MSEFNLFDPLWHEAFYMFMSDPTDHRSKKQFCLDNDLKVPTVNAWISKRREQINKEIEQRRNKFKSTLRTKAYKALDKMMIDDASALKLAFQLLGDLVEKTESRIEHLTPEQKREKALLLIQEVLQKKSGPSQPQESNAGQPGAEGPGTSGSTVDPGV